MAFKKFNIKVKDYIKWSSCYTKAVAVYPKFDEPIEYISVDNMPDKIVMLCGHNVFLVNSKHEAKYVQEEKRLFSNIRCIGHEDMNALKTNEVAVTLI